MGNEVEGRIITKLDELAKKYGTDKGTGGGHQYTSIYYEMFYGKEDKVKKVLEMGIGNAGSLKMWRDWFPNAVVYGMDTEGPENLQLEGYRVFPIQCDVTNEEQMQHWLGLINGNIDFIVDDASHQPDDQIKAAQLALPFMAPDGVFCIEDIGDHDQDTVDRILNAFKDDYDLNFVQQRWPDSRIIIIRNKK